MKKQRLVPVIVISVSIVLLLAASLLAGTSAPADGQSTDSRATTFSAGPKGTRALFLVLDHFIPGVGRLLEPTPGLSPPHGSAPATLLVMQPTRSLGEDEAASLDAWVSGGGQLIIATSAPWRVGKGEKAVDYLSRHGFRMEGPTQDPRLYAGSGGTLLLGATPLARDDFEPLFTGTAAVVGAQRRLGAGRIVVITDGYAWSNERLSQSNNAAWLVMMAGTWKSGRLLVDEYHQGNTGARGTFALILSFLGTFWGIALLQVGLAAAVYLLRGAWRFGPARDLPRERIQDPLQRIRGIGAFLQAAEANEFSAQTITQLAAARRLTHAKERRYE